MDLRNLDFSAFEIEKDVGVENEECHRSFRLWRALFRPQHRNRAHIIAVQQDLMLPHKKLDIPVLQELELIPLEGRHKPILLIPGPALIFQVVPLLVEPFP